MEFSESDVDRLTFESTQKSSSDVDRLTVEKSRETIFTCTLCKLEARYDYLGRRPPFAPQIAFLEDGYICRDPFESSSSLPTRSRPLFLGSFCSLCRAPVCSSPACSFFFSQRFCLPCARRNASAFCPEAQAELLRALGAKA
ncbi:unnamed protein product [Closterium sp. Yama58-4]|nr:unnamed protein product [Closterium sp. Yama58-4]